VLKRLTVGDPLDPKTNLGPVVNEAACRRIMGVIDGAKSQRMGSLALGGNRLGDGLADGYFIEPTVFVDVDPKSSLAQKEIFGPVLSIFRFKTEEEAVELANSTEYGLAAYVQTNDLKRAHRLASQLVAGTIHINGAPNAQAAALFGGIGLSGFGREGGKAGLDEFIRVKNVGIA